MIIQTSDYINISILPDDAKCKLSGKSPMDMFECPSREYNFFGEICIPELCKYYTEGDNDADS